MTRFIRRHAVVALVVALTGCPPGAFERPEPITTRQLDRIRTIFIRVWGFGKMPRIEAPATYELCMDLARGALTDVRVSGTDHSADDQLANVLRGWKWGIGSSVRLKTGVKCWRERFEPVGEGADRGVRAIADGPVQLLGLSDDRVAPGDDRGEDAYHVAFLDMFESGGTRYVFLVPRVSTTVLAAPVEPSPSAIARLQPISGALPHLPDVVKLRYRGNELTATYKLCLDESGIVRIVIPEVPIDGAADALARAFSTWVFTDPHGKVCLFDRFVYTIGP